MSVMREELHHLVDQLPEAELRPALELIRGRVAEQGSQGRDLPFFASFEPEPDPAYAKPRHTELAVDHDRLAWRSASRDEPASAYHASGRPVR